MGPATKLRLAVYLPLAVLAAVVLLLVPGDVAPRASEATAPPPSPLPMLYGAAGPRMVTFGGREFDFDATGDFVLAQVDQLGLEVQARIKRGSDGRPTIDRVASTVNLQWVQFRANGQVLYGDQFVDLRPGLQMDLGQGAFARHVGEVFTLQGPDHGPKVRVRLDDGAVQVHIPRGFDVWGLLENGDPDLSRVAEDESMLRQAP